MRYFTAFICILFFYNSINAQSPLAFQVANDTVSKDQVFTLDVTANNFQDMVTFQFSIGWDSAILDFDTIEAYNSTLPLGTSNFNFTLTNSGKIGVTWFDANVKTLPANTVLFRLKFRADTLGIAEVAFTNDPVEIYAENILGTLAVEPENGLVTIQVEAPSNDLCASAVSIQNLLGNGAGNPQTSTIFDNTNAGTHASDPATGHDCFYEESVGQASGLDNSLWFKFTGDGHHYRITTVQCETGDNYLTFGDAQMAIYKGDCGNLVPVDCNEDIDANSNDYAAQIDDLGAEPFQEYYILVDGCRCIDNNGNAAKGQFCLQVEQLTSVATQEPKAISKLSLSPNPSPDRAVLHFEISENQEVGILLVDQLGRAIRTVLPAKIIPSGAHAIPVELRGLPSGSYYVVLNIANRKETLQLTKL